MHICLMKCTLLVENKTVLENKWSEMDFVPE